MTDITPIVTAFLGLLGAIVTAFLIPYLKQKISTDKLQELNRIVGVAVWAAEMLYKGSGRGEEKKQYVYDSIDKFLANHKLKVDMTTIDNMIESAVLNLKNTVTPKD